MSRTRTAVERMARQPVPTDDQVRRAVLGSQPDRLLHGIVNDVRLRAVPGRGPGHRRWRPVLVVGVAVTAVLAAVAVFVLPAAVGDRPLPGVAGPGPAPALTTAPDPAEVLRQLAERAAEQPAPSAGAVDYVHTRSGSRPRLDNGQIDGSATREEYSDAASWASPDRQGRVEEFKDEQELGSYGEPPRPRPELPADPEDLEPVLLTDSRSFFDGPSLYFALADTWARRAIEPQEQASILRLLATKDEIRLVGSETDHLGREGVVLAVEEAGDVSSPYLDDKSPPKRVVYEHRMVFDQRTGAILEIEHFLVGGLDLVTGPLPQSLFWVAYLEADRVDAVGERP
jgi:hypothetical protein